MKVGSLFSGIGGLDLGLERAGFEIAWQIEINDFCQKILKKHWPDVQKYQDIFSVDFTKLPRVDLLCGGFPCQPVSCAGKRKGSQDERWLWPEFNRAICEIKPRWILVENVPGLLSAENGRLFGGILGDLAAGGYDAEWDCIPAAIFGAPHLRYRVFLVAYSNRSRRQDLTKTSRKNWDADFERSSKKGESDMAHSLEQGLEVFPCQSDNFISELKATKRGSEWWQWWSTEPNVGRVAHGVPSRVDRIKGLGNAVVPQVAEWIGNLILEAEKKNVLKGETKNGVKNNKGRLSRNCHSSAVGRMANNTGLSSISQESSGLE